MLSASQTFVSIPIGQIRRVITAETAKPVFSCTPPYATSRKPSPAVVVARQTSPLTYFVQSRCVCEMLSATHLQERSSCGRCFHLRKHNSTRWLNRTFHLLMIYLGRTFPRSDLQAQGFFSTDASLVCRL